MPQKPVHEQEQDEEPQSVPQTIHENSQEVLEGAQQEVQAAKAPWYLTLKRGRLLLVSWHGGYMLILFCRSTSL